MSDPHAIARKWAGRIGAGFHPDTRGADYRPSMSAADVKEYDADMDTLFEVASDPYGCAVIAMADAGFYDIGPTYPVPATLENVDSFWRQYWRTTNMGEYRDQYDS